jgi:hypothetical protein
MRFTFRGAELQNRDAVRASRDRGRAQNRTQDRAPNGQFSCASPEQPCECCGRVSRTAGWKLCHEAERLAGGER